MSLQVSRRSFLGGVIALAACSVLPKLGGAVPTLWGDGVHCDVEGLTALIRNEPVRIVADGVGILRHGGSLLIRGGQFCLSRTLVFEDVTDLLVSNCDWLAKGDFEDKPLLDFRGNCQNNWFDGNCFTVEARGLDSLIQI